MQEEQSVCFRVGNILHAADRATSRDTKLTAWFKLNQNPDDPDANQWKYWEIPVHYVWDDKNTSWKKRQRGGNKVIGRMYTVSIKDSERFYLRLLLQHETGAKSFEDVRTIAVSGGVKCCETYQEAAKEKGFLLDDSIWQKTLEDAKSYAMPAQMRQLFAYICAFSSPSDPLLLWNENKEDMTEDICRKLHGWDEPCTSCESYALTDIQSALGILGFTL